MNSWSISWLYWPEGGLTPATVTLIIIDCTWNTWDQMGHWKTGIITDCSTLSDHWVPLNCTHWALKKIQFFRKYFSGWKSVKWRKDLTLVNTPSERLTFMLQFLFVIAVNKASGLIVRNLFLIAADWKKCCGSHPSAAAAHRARLSILELLPAELSGMRWRKILTHSHNCESRCVLRAAALRAHRGHMWTGSIVCSRQCTTLTHKQINSSADFALPAAFTGDPFLFSAARSDGTFLCSGNEKAAGCWHVTQSPHTKHHAGDAYWPVPEPPALLLALSPSAFFIILLQRNVGL